MKKEIKNLTFPEVKFQNLNSLDDSMLKRVVIVSRYKNKWVYYKAKTRTTWEIPGGKIENNETPLNAAKRELYEETGAIDFNIKPICIFFVFQPALLCYATIYKFEKNLKYEIEKVEFFDDERSELTYPQIHPFLFKKIKENILD